MGACLARDPSTRQPWLGIARAVGSFALTSGAIACVPSHAAVPATTPVRGEPASRVDARRALEPQPSSNDPLDLAALPEIDTDPTHYPEGVWTSDALTRVGPRDLPDRAQHWVVLSAARNEFESFQVHVRATGKPLEAVEFAVSDLRGTRGERALRAGIDVTIAREEYVEVSTPSTGRGKTGRIADILVPVKDEIFGEARRAFPVSVPSGETRSAWFDVHVPEDAASGVYSGKITVTVSGKVWATLPLLLRVYNFTLPSTPSLASFFAVGSLGLCQAAYGGYARCGQFPGAQGNPDRGVEETHVAVARFLLDRRLSSAEVVYAGSVNQGWEHVDSLYRPLFDGTADTRLRNARLTTVAYVGRPEDESLLGRWADYARRRGFLERFVYYHCDEPPRRCSAHAARAEAQRVHRSAPDVRYLLTADFEFVHREMLEPWVSIVSPNVARLHPKDGRDRRPDYDDFLSRPSKRLFWYVDCSQHESCTPGRPGPAESLWPNYLVDSPPVENRVFQWLAFLYRVDGELYFSVDYCWTHRCGDAVDPFRSVYAFGGQGEGTLIYPGLPSRVGGARPTVLSSIRLEHIRDGIEDHEYLMLLANAGHRGFALAQVSSFIQSAHAFSTEPTDLIAAREALGQKLHRLSLEPR